MAKELIQTTNFHFPGQKKYYQGKVRDVYDFETTLMMVATDRYSAFDRNLALIPYKGELLTAISRWWFEQSKTLIPNHIRSYPDPNVMWCNKYKVLPIEVIVRGYITGVTNTSLWYNYSQGQRDFGNFTLPDNLAKNNKLPHAVITPTTKFEKHDRPLTSENVISEGLVDHNIWKKVQAISLKLFKFGQKMAETKGLILVDTKYEFGLDSDNKLILIDEVHTPDSSRYWRADIYQQQIDKKEEPDNYDKEFLRLWYKSRFDPYKDKDVPKPPLKILNELSNRYIYVYEHLTGQKFTPNSTPPMARIESNINKALRTI